MCFLLVFIAVLDIRCDALVVVVPQLFTRRSTGIKSATKLTGHPYRLNRMVVGGIKSTNYDTADDGALGGRQQQAYNSYNDASSDPSFASPQRRSRLADRIRQLDQQQQQQQQSNEALPSSINENTMFPEMNFDDNSDEDQNELYLKVKQGIVQIQSKEQHSYVLQIRNAAFLSS
jgi:hypothetical protein